MWLAFRLPRPETRGADGELSAAGGFRHVLSHSTCSCNAISCHVMLCMVSILFLPFPFYILSFVSISLSFMFFG